VHTLPKRDILGLLLCIAHYVAIEAVCLLGLSYAVVSLEPALRACGASKPVAREYRTDWLERTLRQARASAVATRGVALGGA
jgi:hypothetical protein